MSVQLLDKIRKINKLLHNNISSKIVFTDICLTMAQVLSSRVLVLSKKGKILGTSFDRRGEQQEELLTGGVGTFIDNALNERLLGILSTKENVNAQMLGFAPSVPFRVTVTPIDIAGERLGTLIAYRAGEEYDIDDIIVTEYGSTVVGLEMIRAMDEESEQQKRQVDVVRSAIATLSFSETKAILSVFDSLNGMEGVLVTSKIADRAGITRSVIVNAIRKFESAGVIEEHSSGMKGTYIKVVNEALYPELQRLREEKLN